MIMEYARNKDGSFDRRQIKDLNDLGHLMAKADYDDWVEGLGMPTCDHDLQVWHSVGRFILNLQSKSENNYGFEHGPGL